MSFPFSHSLWNTEGAIFHSEESVLRQYSMSACLFSALGKYSAITVSFFLNSTSQICLERQTICKFFEHPFSESKSRPLYCPSEYAVTLSPVLSKRFPGLVLIQEVPVRFGVSFCPAECMSLQFSFLPWLPSPLSLKIAWAGNWIKVLSLYISMFFTHQRSCNWDTLFRNTWLS